MDISKEELLIEVEQLNNRITELESSENQNSYAFQDEMMAETTIRNCAPLFSTSTGTELFKHVCSHLTKTLELDYAFIGTLKPSAAKVQVISGIGKGKLMEEFDYDLVDTPCWEVMGKSMCSFPSDVQKLFPKDQLLSEMGINGYIGVPLFKQSGAAIGIMVLLHCKPITNLKFSKALLQIFSALIATEIERIQANEVLRLTETKFSKVFHYSPIPTYITSIPDGIFIEVNPMVEKLSGFSYDELVGKSSLELGFYLNTEDRDKLLEVLQKDRRLNGYSIRFRMKSGIIRNCKIFSEIIEIQGDSCLLSMVQDETESVLAEKEIRSSEEKFKLIFEYAPDPIYLHDLEGNYIDANKAALEMLGYDKEYLIGKNLLETTFLPKKELIKAKKIIAYNAQGKGSGPDEFIVNRKDGKQVQVEISTFPIFIRKKAIVLGIARNISERLKVENEFKRLSTAVEQSPAVITITDLEGIIEYVNPKFVELTGYLREEIIGTNSSFLSPGTQLPEFYEEMWETIKSGKVWKGEFLNKKKNGELFWESASISPIHDDCCKIINYIKVSEDITEKKRNEKQISMLSKAVEQSPSSIIITNEQGKIEFVNAKFISFMQYDLDEVKGKNPRIFNRGHIPEKDYMQMWKNIRSGMIWQGEYINRKKDDTQFLEYVTISPLLDEKGNINNFIIISEDITEKKKILTDLQNAKIRAEESDRLKSAFLASMSHEIRTPLNSIVGFSKIIAESTNDSKMMEFSSIVSKQNNLLLNLINDILDFAKIEAGAVNTVLEEFDLNNLIDELHFRFCSEFSNETKLIPKKMVDSFLIHSDQLRIEQVFSNLIYNAFKFTPKGVVTYGYYLNDNSEVICFVKDTGIGIPHDKKEYIFNKFTKLDAFTQGTGLGLTISRNIVELLGGKMWIESELGIGSCFYFTIPIRIKKPKIEKNELGTMNNISLKEDIVRKKVGTILIAEDNEENYKYMVFLLKELCDNIIHAVNGLKAVEQVKMNDNIDLILMDLKMPVMNGIEATRQIKQIKPQIPIIACTAYAQPEDENKAKESGCNDYISKPIKKSDLIKKIMENIN